MGGGPPRGLGRDPPVLLRPYSVSHQGGVLYPVRGWGVRESPEEAGMWSLLPG